MSVDNTDSTRPTPDTGTAAPLDRPDAGEPVVRRSQSFGAYVRAFFVDAVLWGFLGFCVCYLVFYAIQPLGASVEIQRMVEIGAWMPSDIDPGVPGLKAWEIQMAVLPWILSGALLGLLLSFFGLTFTTALFGRRAGRIAKQAMYLPLRLLGLLLSPALFVIGAVLVPVYLVLSSPWMSGERLAAAFRIPLMGLHVIQAALGKTRLGLPDWAKRPAGITAIATVAIVVCSGWLMTSIDLSKLTDEDRATGMYSVVGRFLNVFGVETVRDAPISLQTPIPYEVFNMSPDEVELTEYPDGVDPEQVRIDYRFVKLPQNGDYLFVRRAVQPEKDEPLPPTVALELIAFRADPEAELPWNEEASRFEVPEPVLLPMDSLMPEGRESFIDVMVQTPALFPERFEGRDPDSVTPNRNRPAVELPESVRRITLRQFAEIPLAQLSIEPVGWVLHRAPSERGLSARTTMLSRPAIFAPVEGTYIFKREDVPSTYDATVMERGGRIVMQARAGYQMQRDSNSRAIVLVDTNPSWTGVSQEPQAWGRFSGAIPEMIETVFLALMATILALPLAFIFSFLGAANLMTTSTSGTVIYYLVRTVMNIFRSIEPLAWAIIFSVWVGIGTFAGILALMIHTIASLTKLYSEQIEGIDPGPIEALRATGAGPLATIRHAIVPQVIPPFISFTMYRWDINVRMAPILGFVGGGGIGTMLKQHFDSAEWEEVGVIILLITLVVAAMDFASAKIRARIA